MDKHLVLTEISDTFDWSKIEKRKQYGCLSRGGDTMLFIMGDALLNKTSDTEEVYSHIYMPPVLPLSKEEIEKMAEDEYPNEHKHSWIVIHKKERTAFIKGFESCLSFTGEFAEWACKNYSQSNILEGCWYSNDKKDFKEYGTAELMEVFLKEKGKSIEKKIES